MSTTFQSQTESLQRVVDAVAELPVKALVTTGPVIDPGTITAPPNVTVVAAAPHTRVLRDAALVVTHGGHGTLVKSFVAGVPVVVLPHGRDQADNAARVVHHGAGKSVPRAASPATIADAVRTVLEDRSFAELEGAPAHRAFGAHPLD